MTQQLVLVTGGGGFLGAHVAKRFASAGWNVVALGHGAREPAWSTDAAIVNWVDGDVDMASLVALGTVPDVIVHCAGGGAVGFSVSNPREDFMRTVDSTSQLLEFMRKHAGEATLVYPSSAAVYGNSPDYPVAESSPLAPISPYGHHKKMAEDLIRSYMIQYGIRSAGVRFFSLYGRGLRKQLLWDACRKLQAGQVEFAGTGEELRDWLHVSDAVDLLFLLATRETEAGTWVNGASGVGVSVRHILDSIHRFFPAAGEIRFNGARRAGDPVRLVGCGLRGRELGWTPRVAWLDGVADYIEWFKKQS